MQVQFHKKQCNFSTAELRLVARYALEVAFDFLPLAERWDEEGLEASISLSFVGEEAIRAANRDFRQVDRVTDVLSFPMLQLEEGELLEPLSVADYDPVQGQVFLGDLLLCPQRAEEQANEYGHSLQREVAFLCVHGLLHLMGYDHEQDEAGRLVMESLQDTLLENLGLHREMTAQEALLHVKQQLHLREELEKQFSEEKIWTDEAKAAYGGEAEKTRKSFRSGFVTIVGRPNAGKSTLLNRISGQRLAIVSHKAQTTRHNIRAIYNDEEAQIVFTDTPGLHRADTDLGKYMQEVAWKALHDADVLVLLLDATKTKLNELEKSSLQAALDQQLPLLFVLNKVDAVEKERLLPLMSGLSQLAPGIPLLPLSAKTGVGMDSFFDEIKKRLPEGPRYYDEESFTDQSERQIAAEMIREQLLLYTHEEVPHGTAVQIDSFEEIEGEEEERRLVRIHASILCDKDSHKGIIIGRKGQSLRRIGSAARQQIEEMLGCKVYLDLHVKVRPDWRNRRGILSDLGYSNR